MAEHYQYQFTDAEWSDCERQAQKVIDRAGDKHKSEHYTAALWDTTKHLVGAATELAAAKFLGVAPNWGEHTMDQPDLLNGVEVRGTAWATGHLIVHHNDKKRPFVFGTVDLTKHQVILRGWKHLDECRQEKYWRPKSTTVTIASFWIPQSDLNELTELKEMVSA